MKSREDAKKLAKSEGESIMRASSASTRLRGGTGGAPAVVIAVFMLCMLSKCTL